jgi:hypothetical protein
MSDSLTERLNEILPRITSDDFLAGRGIGNEIAFYIFDYPPEHELRVREHVQFLLDQMPKVKPGLRAVHVNLLQFVVDHLRSRKLLDKTFELQKQKGDAFVLKHLEKILHPEKLAPLFAEQVQPNDQDLVLVTGVGSVWPLLRTHSLLSNLHPVMGKTPLVMFYPGRYDGQLLKLFGKVKNQHYYRAFKLIP